jgi:hypothetical protein
MADIVSMMVEAKRSAQGWRYWWLV